MTPEEHYAQAEKHTTRATTMQGAASDAAIRHAILAVAHALLSLRNSAFEPFSPVPPTPVPEDEIPEPRRWDWDYPCEK